MLKCPILKIITLCFFTLAVSACSFTSTFQSLTGHAYGSKSELINGKWVDVKPREPDNFDLEVEKTLVGDVLVGQACKNKFTFEIKVLATNGDYVGNKAYYDSGIEQNSMTKGHLFSWAHAQDTISVPSLRQDQVMAVLTVKSEASQQFKTELVANLDKLRRGNGLMTYYAYNVSARGRQITVEEAKADQSRALRLDIMKDANGIGWEGTIEGENFPACTDLTLKSKQGRNTGKFAPPHYPYFDENALQTEAKNKPKYGVVWLAVNPEIQTYWTKKFFEETKKSTALQHEQNYDTGRIYEKIGKILPESYTFALQTYLNAAKRQDDVRVFSALARMYGAGLGTNKDANESKKWLDMVHVAYRQANDVCISPEVLRTFKIEWDEIERRNAGLNYLVNSALGTESELGRIVIGKIEADDLINLKKPFKCSALIQRVDAHVDLGEPDYYVGTDGYGNQFYYDNSLAKAVSGSLSSFFDQLSRRPFSDEIKIYPTNDGRYEINEKINGKQQRIVFSANRKK